MSAFEIAWVLDRDGNRIEHEPNSNPVFELCRTEAIKLSLAYVSFRNSLGVDAEIVALNGSRSACRRNLLSSCLQAV